MCFYNDYDWQAEVSEDSMKEVDRQADCYECSRVIAVGETARYISQQQYESCQCENCQDNFLGRFLFEKCPNRDFGETFDCVICQDCCKILTAIESHEEKEGCPRGSRQPSYGGLYEEAFAQDEFEANKYAKAAVEMFPELATHRFVADALNAVIED